MPYSKNFLNKVIARVDHLPILILDDERPSSFQELVRNEYPRIAEFRGVGIEMPKQGSSLVSVEKLPVIWKLNNKDRTIEIDLSSKYFSLVSSRYVGFLEFFDRLSDVYNHFVENYSPSIITRVGLRYVNEISLDGNPFEWQNLLNENLYSTLNAFPICEVLLLALCISYISRGMTTKSFFNLVSSIANFQTPLQRRSSYLIMIASLRKRLNPKR